jgi:hypothetical protein
MDVGIVLCLDDAIDGKFIFMLLLLFLSVFREFNVAARNANDVPTNKHRSVTVTFQLARVKRTKYSLECFI